MTIGVCFSGANWIVMGADRQMTSPGWHKHSEKKIFHDLTGERIIALIGGDDLGLATEIWWKLLDHPISDYESYERALTDILNDMGRLTTDLPLQLLCGIATKRDTFIFEFRGRGIQPIPEFGVICAGDSSLIRYFVKHIDFLRQSASEGVVIASYLLKRAEEFIDGCHGPMDVIALRPGPQINSFDSALIDELDKKMADNHIKAFRDLFSLSPPFST